MLICAIINIVDYYIVLFVFCLFAEISKGFCDKEQNYDKNSFERRWIRVSMALWMKECMKCEWLIFFLNDKIILDLCLN